MELFGTAGIRGPVTGRVTPALAVRVGRAVGRHAREAASEADGDDHGRDDRTFVVGRDGRTTGEGLAAAVTAGLTASGADVIRIGQVPTPALASASQGRRGVMLTASHNPPTDNGIKLFVDGEEYGRTAELAVERAVDDEQPPVPADEWGTTRRRSVLDDYREAVTEYARQVLAWTDATPFRADETAAAGNDTESADGRHRNAEPAAGLRVAVDTGNGMGGVATPAVLRELGASVVTLNANVDGRFPGRESKPTAESLRDLRGFVADDGADLGIAHDGDADRIVILDPDGELVHEDTVVAVLAEAYTHAARVTPAVTTTADTDASDDTNTSDDRRPTVVTTPNASDRIDERVTAAGGRVERVALGYLHDGIGDARAAGERVAFAAEPWKHVHPAFGPWIDGVASAAVLAALVGRHGLATLREPVTERPYRKESLSCSDDDKAAAMDRLGEMLPDAFPEASVDTEYGVRLSFSDSSWILVRPSGTEPYLRVYAESDDVDALVEEASAVVTDTIDAVSE